MATPPPPPTTAAAGTPAPHGGARVEAMLAAHVPLSLLLDLVDPGGPQSADLLREERACSTWVQRR